MVEQQVSRPERAALTNKSRSRWQRPAIIILAAASIAYVIYKVPPYLTFDSKNSRIPPEHAWHFAMLSGHVICGSLSLLTAALQLWPWLRRAHPRIHRISGRVYIFGGALPSAVLAIAMYPVTPGPGRVAVMVAAPLWAIAAVLGLVAARQRRYEAHRRWMVYSFAIMWGYGVWVFVFANLFYYGFKWELPTAVEAARWGGWTTNVLIAHWWLERRAGRSIVGAPLRRRKLDTPAVAEA